MNTLIGSPCPTCQCGLHARVDVPEKLADVIILLVGHIQVLRRPAAALGRPGVLSLAAFFVAARSGATSGGVPYQLLVEDRGVVAEQTFVGVQALVSDLKCKYECCCLLLMY